MTRRPTDLPARDYSRIAGAALRGLDAIARRDVSFSPPRVLTDLADALAAKIDRADEGQIIAGVLKPKIKID